MNIPSRANAIIAIAQIAAITTLLVASRHARGWTLALFALAFAIVMNSVYSIIHEAEHGILFHDRRANDAAGVAMALLFPAPFHLIRQGHLGHHARNLRLFAPIDAIWLNHNWHLTHHRHPTVPWPHLPALAREEQQADRGFIVVAYARMWRGPRRGQRLNAVILAGADGEGPAA